MADEEQKTLLKLIKSLDDPGLSEAIKTLAADTDLVAQAAAALFKHFKNTKEAAVKTDDVMKEVYTQLIDGDNKATEALKARIVLLNTIATQTSANETEAKKTALKMKARSTARLKDLEGIAAVEKRSLKYQQDIAKVVEKSARIPTRAGAPGRPSPPGRPASTPRETKAPITDKDVAKAQRDMLKGAAALHILQKAGPIARLPGAKAVTKGMQDGATAAKEQYESVSTLTTGYAQFTGQIMDADAAVGKNTIALIKNGKALLAPTFAERIIEMTRANDELGATHKDMVNSYKSLFTESRTFGKLQASNTTSARTFSAALAEQAFVFSKAGIKAESYGANLDVIGKTYREKNLPKETKKLTSEMLGLARATGQIPDIVQKEFVGAMDILSSYSLPEASRQFALLSATAAASGVKTAKLLDIAKKFDDMEGAADIVGELNALLGGPYLNTLDLVNAKEGDRIKMIKGAMQAEGKNFAQMDSHMKKAIAAKLQMTVQEAQRVFTVPQSEIDATLKSMKDKTLGFDDMRKAAKNNATGMKEQRAAVTASMTISEKAFGKVDKVARSFNSTIKQMGNQIRKVFTNTLLVVLKKVETIIFGIKKALDLGQWQKAFTRILMLKTVWEKYSPLALLGTKTFDPDFWKEMGTKKVPSKITTPKQREEVIRRSQEGKLKTRMHKGKRVPVLSQVVPQKEEAVAENLGTSEDEGDRLLSKAVGEEGKKSGTLEATIVVDGIKLATALIPYKEVLGIPDNLLGTG